MEMELFEGERDKMKKEVEAWERMKK